MKKYLWGWGTIILVAAVFLCFVLLQKSNKPILPTYFTYGVEDINAIRHLSSSHKITQEDIYATDELAFDLVSKYTLKKDFTEEVSKIYAYQALAERDFAFISHNISGDFSGHIETISRSVLCLYFKDNCANVSSSTEDDEYSRTISALVMSKVKERIAEDASLLKPYQIKVGEEYWNGPQPSTGLSNGKSKGWFITSGSEFRALPPPSFRSKEFREQLSITQDALKKATPEQKLATVFWAGGPGTKTPPGQLLALGDEYMQSNRVSLSKVLLVRSVLTMAVADAVTSVFDSKYTYFVKRPFMMDPSIVTIMPTPNHPSYPAGHSTLSAAGATVLTYYFPEAKATWEAKAYEAGMSRIWGGIHYMMDHEAGVEMGRRVGEKAIAGTQQSK